MLKKIKESAFLGTVMFFSLGGFVGGMLISTFFVLKGYDEWNYHLFGLMDDKIAHESFKCYMYFYKDGESYVRLLDEIEKDPNFLEPFHPGCREYYDFLLGSGYEPSNEERD